MTNGFWIYVYMYKWRTRFEQGTRNSEHGHGHSYDLHDENKIVDISKWWTNGQMNSKGILGSFITLLDGWTGLPLSSYAWCPSVWCCVFWPAKVIHLWVNIRCRKLSFVFMRTKNAHNYLLLLENQSLRYVYMEKIISKIFHKQQRRANNKMKSRII